MKIMKLENLTSGDVYEFTYCKSYNQETLDNFKNKDSIYISDEDFKKLGKYINLVFPQFNYFGPNKIKLKEWKELEDKILISEDIELIEFMTEFNLWISSSKENENCFWILGI